jgi:hypothetical protein
MTLMTQPRGVAAMNASQIRYRQHVLDCLTCRRARAVESLCAVGLKLYDETLELVTLPAVPDYTRACAA